MRYAAAVVAMMMVLWTAGKMADHLSQGAWLAMGVAALLLPWFIIKRWPK